MLSTHHCWTTLLCCCVKHSRPTTTVRARMCSDIPAPQSVRVFGTVLLWKWHSYVLGELYGCSWSARDLLHCYCNLLFSTGCRQTALNPECYFNNKGDAFDWGVISVLFGFCLTSKSFCNWSAKIVANSHHWNQEKKKGADTINTGRMKQSESKSWNCSVLLIRSLTKCTSLA